MRWSSSVSPNSHDIGYEPEGRLFESPRAHLLRHFLSSPWTLQGDNGIAAPQRMLCLP
jgi:hypothetical protein